MPQDGNMSLNPIMWTILPDPWLPIFKSAAKPNFIIQTQLQQKNQQKVCLKARKSAPKRGDITALFCLEKTAGKYFSKEQRYGSPGAMEVAILCL